MATKWSASKAQAIAIQQGKIRMARAMLAVLREVKTLLNVGGGKGHEPSTPPEPPHKQTGQLYRSIASSVEVVGFLEIVGRVGTNHPGARRLEFGFKGSDALGRTINQMPRPFLRPGLQNAKGPVKAELAVGRKR